jgi:hypothetical protein
MIPFLSSNQTRHVFSHPATPKLKKNKLGLFLTFSSQTIEHFFTVRYAMRMGATDYKMVDEFSFAKEQTITEEADNQSSYTQKKRYTCQRCLCLSLQLSLQSNSKLSLQSNSKLYLQSNSMLSTHPSNSQMSLSLHRRTRRS